MASGVDTHTRSLLHESDFKKPGKCRPELLVKQVLHKLTIVLFLNLNAFTDVHMSSDTELHATKLALGGS